MIRENLEFVNDRILAERAEGRIALHHIDLRLNGSESDAESLMAGVWATVSGLRGNCYPVAAIVGLAAERAGYKTIVVHGRPTLQVAPHTPYEHAWVEVETRMGWFAIDLSNRCNVALPVARYYELGKIRIEDDAATYTPTELWQWITDNGHYGPYHISVNAEQERADGEV